MIHHTLTVFNVLIGFMRYEDTAKGVAMEVNDCFVKVIVGKYNNRVLGAHIIGPHASILIHQNHTSDVHP